MKFNIEFRIYPHDVERFYNLRIPHQIAFLFFVFALVTKVNGQQYKFCIGAEASPGLVSCRGNEILKLYNKQTIGFSGGLFFQYSLSKTFSLRTNISFQRKGTASNYDAIKDNAGNFLASIPSHSNFDYLTLPILARLTIDKKIKYYINAGPYFGYLLKQTDLYKNPSSTIDATNLDQHLDFGISTGLGITMPIKKQYFISFEVRNDLGLFNVNGVPPSDDWIIKTNSLNLLIGFAYQFGLIGGDKK